jgi:hypothetical protein
MVAGAFAAAAAAATGGSTGPSSSQSPYLVRSHAGVVFKSILTTGDSVPRVGGGTYRMVGIPDGLGAFDNGDGTFTLLVNHELNGTVGVPRAHGGNGAFVSRWVIDKSDLSVVGGEDQIKTVNLWDATAGAYVPGTKVVFSRFCSADLPRISALYNAETGKGYDGRIFMDGEEAGAEGRAFAHVVADGSTWELPGVGKMSFENSLANWGTGDRTIVAATDDQGGGRGQVYVYAGDKKTSGNAVEKAGLTGGSLFGIKVDGVAFENAASGIPSGTHFSTYAFGDVSSWSGAQLETASNTNGVTNFRRPEDGSWDPVDPNVFYFVTTDVFNGKSRLWRLNFQDASRPELGGTIDMLLDGTEGQNMLDNITPNRRGQIVAQEDIGDNTPLGKVWLYDIDSDTLTQVAEHDPDRFAVDAPDFITIDDESSGVIDASRILGSGWYLLDVQAHKASSDPELVEGGQLLAMHIAAGKLPQ